MPDQIDTREAVRRRYADAALRVLDADPAARACCGGASCGTAATATTCCPASADPVTGDLCGC